MFEPQETNLRPKTGRSSRWAREASVFIWLLMAALALIALLFWLF
jgi:hypothetical protein